MGGSLELQLLIVSLVYLAGMVALVVVIGWLIAAFIRAGRAP